MTAKRRLRPRKEPKQERAQRTVEAIVEAAAQVFEREGYSRTTTDRIAERAGVSIGSLYQYFPGKDSILAALAERHADSGVGRIRELLSASGGTDGLASVGLAPLLRSFVQELLELHQAQPRLQRLLFLEAPVPLEQHARLSKIEDDLAAEISALLSQHPDVRTSQPALAAWMLVHATHGLVHDFIVHPPPQPTDREDFLDQLVHMLQAYLSA